MKNLFAKNIAVCVVATVSAVCCVSSAEETEIRTRALHFPKDRSLGSLYTCDATVQRRIKDFHYWIDGLDWEYLGEATGAVTVPAAKRLKLVLNKTSRDDLSALKQLRPDDLYELCLGRNTDERCLPHLATLTGLKFLQFPRAFDDKEKLPRFTPQGLKQLANLKSLERLEAPDRLSNAGLTAIAEALPQLEALYLNNNYLTDQGLTVLPKFTALEELKIGGQNLSSRGLAVLADMPSLHYLSFWGKHLNDDTLLQVRKIASLKTLAVPSWITDAGIAHLAGHLNLEILGLYNTKVTDRGLIHLATMPSLKMLDLGKRDFDRKKPPFTDAGTVHLKEIKSLEYLYLLADGVGDLGLANLAGLDHLKTLEFQMFFSADPKNNPGKSLFTEKGVKDLARNRSLESLCLLGPAVTDDALSDIAQLTNLSSLTLYGCPITDKGFIKLASLQSLKSLVVRHPAQVTVSALNRLDELSRLSNLQLDLSTPDKPDGQALNLTNLTRLKSVMLSAKKGSTFRDEDLAGLANLKQLKSLQLGIDLAITDTGLVKLAGLTSLQRLAIGGPHLTDRSLTRLTNMPGLTSVIIGGRFTDAGLQQLEPLKALECLEVFSITNLAQTAKERLRQKLPNLVRFSVVQDRNLGRPGRTGSTHPKPGTLAPDFSVTTLDGAKFKLSEQRGKVVLLHFWGTWCGPCVKGLPALNRYHEHLKQKYGERVVLLDLVMDDTDFKLRDMVATHKLTTPQARIGMRSELAASYGVEGAPDDFMIGPDGRVLLNRESPEGPGDTEPVIDRALGLQPNAKAAR